MCCGISAYGLWVFRITCRRGCFFGFPLRAATAQAEFPRPAVTAIEIARKTSGRLRFRLPRSGPPENLSDRDVPSASLRLPRAWERHAFAKG